MISTMSQSVIAYKELPQKLEAGTMMIAEVFGLGAALEFYQALDSAAVRAHIKMLRAYAIEQLQDIPNVIVYNEEMVEARTITFNMKQIHAHDVATVFSENKVVVRAGHHCAQLLLAKLETSSTVRMSIGPYNTINDIDRFIDVAKKAGDFLDVLFG